MDQKRTKEEIEAVDDMSRLTAEAFLNGFGPQLAAGFGTTYTPGDPELLRACTTVMLQGLIAKCLDAGINFDELLESARAVENEARSGRLPVN